MQHHLWLSRYKQEVSNVTFFTCGAADVPSAHRKHAFLYYNITSRHYEYVSLYSKHVWLKWDNLVARDWALYSVSKDSATFWNSEWKNNSTLIWSFLCFIFYSSVTSPRSWSGGFDTWLITSPITCTVTSVALCLRGTNSSFPSSSAAIYSCKSQSYRGILIEWIRLLELDFSF